MNAFKLAENSDVEFRIRSSHARKFAVQLEARTESIRVAELQTQPNTWHTMVFKVEKSPAGGNWEMLQIWDDSDSGEKEPVRLWIDSLKVRGQVVDDFEPSSEGWRGRGVLQVVDAHLDELVKELQARGLPDHEARRLARSYPERARQQLVIVEWMTRHATDVLEGDPTKYLARAIQDDIAPPAAFGARPQRDVEYCLFPTPKEGAAMILYRNLSAHRLTGVEQFKFKMRSEKPCSLTFHLVTPSGSSSADVKIAESDSRKTYRIALSEFKPQESLDLSQVTELRIEEKDDSISGRIWLDNISFNRPVRKIPFKIAATIRCLVPTVVGTILFVALMWLLKVEEAREVTVWLKENGVAKIKKKLGRK